MTWTTLANNWPDKLNITDRWCKRAKGHTYLILMDLPANWPTPSTFISLTNVP